MNEKFWMRVHVTVSMIMSMSMTQIDMHTYKKVYVHESTLNYYVQWF